MLVNSQPLYQLSYKGMKKQASYIHQETCMGLCGLESRSLAIRIVCRNNVPKNSLYLTVLFGPRGNRTPTPLLGTDFLTTTVFTATKCLWSGLSLSHILPNLGSCHTVSTPSSFEAWLGIAI